MRIAIAQMNTTVGDFRGNEAKILEAYQRGLAEGVDLVITPELAVTGYPPRDLLLKPQFIEENLASLARITKEVRETGLIVGYVERRNDPMGRPIRNAAALLHQGAQITSRSKMLLPTYDVFDEDRYFEPALENTPIQFKGRALGLTICEDAWNDPEFWFHRRYSKDPIEPLLSSPCDILINIAASPWHLGKLDCRSSMLKALIRGRNAHLVYCNLVGGNDDLVFDGTSLAFGKDGSLLCRAKSFSEDFQIVDLDSSQTVAPVHSSDEERIYQALVLGIRDYLNKCGFRSAVIGLSGGIDSAVTAVLARAALGKESVRGVAMPSQYSSQGSLDDAAQLAVNLGIQYDVIGIEPAFETMKQSLAGAFRDTQEDITEENIQARLRGVLLMALSNKFGSLLLTTGNKSELAVGYCTLYGDMCGGLAAISDVPKTMVFRLARWINRNQEIIPTSTIEKSPSAELRPGQKDQDSLPDYETLDAILNAYVVELKSPKEIIAEGLPADAVKQVVTLIERNEYKRRQAAPGLKVTSKAFGVGRRIPIAQRLST
ncbi:MAG: Glutamine-dependent NAD(+) synthetase [Verrucomicrobia subdivision 3 bacterium]|nr:Glutamine-dependent NAD(+) synthetase [Limisphaerales bacterium]MCS1415086.1 Glutamine-dependent NAD(+) synthetase [Limisphaerales bacterium]